MIIRGLRPDYTRVPQNVFDVLSVGGKQTANFSAGARVCFSSPTPEITVKIEIDKCERVGALPLGCIAACDLYINGKYRATYGPTDFGITEYEFTFENTGGDIMIYLPIFSSLKNIEITGDIRDEVKGYAHKTPIAFYGSSITAGVAASRPGKSYPAILSQRLDTDFLNFGVPGGCRGEALFAQYINSFDISMLIMEYDHNAFHAEELEERHECFFKTVREAKPELPILILSKPDFFNDHENNARRRDVIYRTYSNAQAAGDRNVYFLDGSWLYAGRSIVDSTVDGIHPKDETFEHFADILEPIIKTILKRE